MEHHAARRQVPSTLLSNSAKAVADPKPECSSRPRGSPRTRTDWMNLLLDPLVWLHVQATERRKGRSSGYLAAHVDSAPRKHHAQHHAQHYASKPPACVNTQQHTLCQLGRVASATA